MSDLNSTTESAAGTCLCGAVSVTTKSLDKNLGVCHCNMCRKWSAGPFFAVDCKQDLKIEGAEFVTAYSSSEWAERGFCKKCGTALFYKLKETGQYIVSSELFQNIDLNFDHQIFIDEKPDYYSFSNKTKNMTGKEVFEAFASKS